MYHKIHTLADYQKEIILKLKYVKCVHRKKTIGRSLSCPQHCGYRVVYKSRLGGSRKYIVAALSEKWLFRQSDTCASWPH